jgi:hypothetical protein
LKFDELLFNKLGFDKLGFDELRLYQKNDLDYYNAGVVAVNLKVVGLAPRLANIYLRRMQLQPTASATKPVCPLQFGNPTFGEFGPGLPDFSWSKIPKRGKLYPITTKYTKWP